MTTKAKLLTLADVSHIYPIMSEIAWRSRILKYRKELEDAGCIIKKEVSEKYANIFIDAKKFEKWFNSKEWITLANGYKGIAKKA